MTGESDPSVERPAPTLPEIGDVWEWCLSVEYDRQALLAGLTDWLGPPAGLRILDASCGSGFPALELRRLGYRVACSDGSAVMLERFRRNAEIAGLPTDAMRATWDELGTLLPGRFDVVLCRGCSLIYAGTWDSESDPDPGALRRSIRGLVGCLSPGGRLYLDVAEEVETRDEDPPWAEHAHRTAAGKPVLLRERVVAEVEAGIRRWQVEAECDGRTTRLERKSHYLPHAQLVEICRGEGLADFQRIVVPGESYPVFTGRKPGGFSA